MHNYLPSNSLPSNLIEKDREPNSLQNLYTQSFQCYCGRTFKTLEDYQVHFQNEDHNNYQPIQAVQQPPNFGLIFQQPNQIVQPINGVSVNLHSSANETSPVEFPQSQNLIQRAVEASKFAMRNFNRNQENQAIQQSQNHPLSQVISQKASSYQPQQKELTFKYVQNYYEHKMAPFYRQLDIQPYKSEISRKQKSSYNHRYPEGYRGINVNPQRSIKYVRQSAFNDKKKIVQQMDLRMIPVQNGIIEFIEDFIKQNADQMNLVTRQKQDSVSRDFFDKITNLQQITSIVQERSRTQKVDPNKEEDFMQTDIFIALNSFLRFIGDRLRLYELWVAQAILLIVVDTIIEYYTINQEHIQESLKVCDMPYLFQRIQMNSQEPEKYSLPLTIDSKTITQFLFWFTQWSTVLQYINNKGRIDFIEPLFDQINEINEVYQENFNNYNQCAAKRRAEYLKRWKKKMIQKDNKKVKIEKERQLKRKQSRKQPRFFRFSNTLNSQDGEINGTNQRINYRQNEVKSSRPFVSTVNSTINSEGHKEHINPYEYENKPDFADRSPYPIKRKADTTQSEEKFSATFEPTKLHPSHQNSREQISFPYMSHQAKLMKLYGTKQQISQNQQDVDDQDNSESDFSEQNFPVYQSQYVNYFSPEKEQERKKQEELWHMRLNKFMSIIKNPKDFKGSMKDQIYAQLKQVQLFMNSIYVSSRLFNYFKRETNNFFKNFKFAPRTETTQQTPIVEEEKQTEKKELEKSSEKNQKIQQEREQNIFKAQPSQNVLEPIKLQKPSKSAKQDAFSVIKNYRQRKNNDKKSEQIFKQKPLTDLKIMPPQKPNPENNNNSSNSFNFGLNNSSDDPLI